MLVVSVAVVPTDHAVLCDVPWVTAVFCVTAVLVVCEAPVVEALPLPYDEKARHGDLGYRFRMHGAHYLADDPAQRAALARKLRGIYEMRSRLVHGGKYPSLDEIQTTRSDARDLARRGLLRAVHEGFPTAGAFNRMVLGTE